MSGRFVAKPGPPTHTLYIYSVNGTAVIRPLINSKYVSTRNLLITLQQGYEALRFVEEKTGF